MTEPTPHPDLRTPAWARVDLDAVAGNYRFLRERVGRRPVFAVVKADAYGHGAAAVARRLNREGADRFAVAQTQEGAMLRRAGVTGEILVLSHAPPSELPRMRAYGLTPVLYDREQARALALAARDLGQPLAVHLELDTGMGRAGIRPEEVDAVVAILAGAPLLALSGTFANLSSADDPDSPETGRQAEALSAGVARLRAGGLDPGLVHLANSAGVLAHPATWFDAVRPGLALYGIAPSQSLAAPGLVAALSLATRVVAARRVPAGTPLGYGGRFVTRRDTTVAVLAIGYHDGLRRSLSGKAEVLLRGARAPIVGAVSMDITLVDATDTGAAPGDPVLIGSADGLAVTAWDLARAAGTIPYEILCGIGPRVTRVYEGAGA